MSYYLEITEEDDYRWLEGVVIRLHTKAENNPSGYAEVLQTLRNLREVFQLATKDAPNGQSGVVEANYKERKPRRSSEEVKEALFILCSDHPTYQGQRVPRRLCPTCWDVYERLHGKDPRRQKAFAEQNEHDD